MDYFYLKIREENPSMVIAVAPEKVSPAYQLIAQLKDKDKMPFDFKLSQITSTQNGVQITSEIMWVDNIWLDYINSNLAWPLMSKRMKDIISYNLSSQETANWIQCSVYYRLSAV